MTKKMPSIGALCAAVLSAMALGACGAAEPSSVGAPVPTVSTTPPYEAIRPVEQLERDLGLMLSVSQNDELMRRALCLDPLAELDPAHTVPPNGQLKMTDLAAFHAQFGYGVVANYTDALAVQRVRSEGDHEVDISSTEGCSKDQGEDLGGYFPPTEATVRAYSLIRGVEAMMIELREYEEWAACMSKVGYDVSEVGLDVRLLVQAQLDEALGALDDDVEYSETLHELPAATIDTLRSEELHLWQADGECLRNSGLGAMLSTELTQVKNQLAAEYPSLDLSE